jgi:hypothetical protein
VHQGEGRAAHHGFDLAGLGHALYERRLAGAELALEQEDVAAL